MSFFLPIQPPCPSCDTESPMELVLSVNADRRPQLRLGMLDGTFQRQTCPACGATFRPEPEFIYQDVGRGQWIAVEPVDNLAQWQTLEDKAYATWDRAFGDRAGGPAREIGEALTPRVTFGWPAVVEKLLCAEHGIDDIHLELMKMSIIRMGGSVPMDDTTELRLARVEGDTLVLGWIEAKAETPVSIIEIPQSGLEGYNTEAWAPLRAQVSAGLYVDMNRLLAGA